MNILIKSGKTLMGRRMELAFTCGHEPREKRGVKKKP